MALKPARGRAGENAPRGGDAPALVRDPAPGRTIMPGAGAGADGPNFGLAPPVHWPCKVPASRAAFERGDPTSRAALGRGDPTSTRGDGKITTLDHWPHPLTAEGRQARPVVVEPGATLATVIAAELPGAGDIEAMVNGRPVPRAAWAETRLGDGQVVTLRAALAGGGGGGKNPLRVVLQLAILFAAIIVPPLLTANAFGQALIGGAIAIAGGLLVDAIAPLSTPGIDTADGPAPVYSLSGGANRARPYGPLLLVLGEHRVFPDLGASEYTEYIGEDQYLHQIFHFGLGALDVDLLKFGTTDLDDFDDVERAWGSGPLSQIELIAGNVDTIAGGSLRTTEFTSRATAANTKRVGIDIVGRVFRYDDAEIREHAVTLEIEWRAGGERLGGETIELRHDSQSALRRTITYDLPRAARWTVRVRRTTEPSDDDAIYDDVTWAALRAYQPDTGDYRGQSRLGVRMKASGQVSGRLDRLSARVRQRVPTWNGTAWTEHAVSSNPAWIFRWYARGIYVANERRTVIRLAAGAGLPSGRIDDETIKAWGAWCAARGLECNFVIDRTMSHAEVLALIARCGRASPSWQTGKLGVVWDDAGRPATALVTPGNIVAGSFRVEYATGQLADEVAVRYVEPEMDWQYNTLRRTAPGVIGSPTSSATVTLPGVTGREQAAMACNLQVARQHFHRRRLVWDMAAEGLALMRGDVVTITHSLIDGGTAGRLKGGTAQRVTLDREVAIAAGDRALFRMPDGALHDTPIARAPSDGTGRTRELTLGIPLPRAPGAADANPLDTLWRIYDDDLPPVRARIIAMQPLTDRRVRCIAIDEVEAYYQSATLALDEPLPTVRSRVPRILDIAVGETLVRVGAGFAVEIEAVLTVAGDWRGGVVRVSIDGGPVRVVARLVDGETTARWLAPPTGRLVITVTPGTEVAPSGAPFTVRYDIVGPLGPPGPPTNFLIDVLGDGTRRLRWTPPRDADLAGILIRYAAQARPPLRWDELEPLHRGFLTSSPLETVDPPSGVWVFSARSIDTGGRMSADEVRIVAELGPQRQGDAIVWYCPSATGWPGTRSDTIERSNDGRDALENVGDYTWDDLTTWDAWVSWTTGNGRQATTEIMFRGTVEDLSAVFDSELRWTGDTQGTVVFEFRVSNSRLTIAAAPWQPYMPAVAVRGRYVQMRWRVTGDGTQVLSLDHLCWSVHAPGTTRKLLDVNTATWEGSAADGRIVPNDLRLVTDLDVTLQSVGAGWSWTLLTKNNPTRIRIYDGDGEPADAVVDVVVRGVAA